MAPRFAGAVASDLIDLLFPTFCLGCGTRLATDPRSLLLCLRCRGQLRTLRTRERCPTCTRSLPAAALPAACAGCRVSPPPFDRLLAAWIYEPPLDRVLHALKFARLEFLAERLVARALDAEALGASGPWDLAVPIPLAPWRRLVRGFNQAERIAAALSARLGIPCREVLARRDLAPTPQTRLGGALRRRHLQGRLRVRRPEEVAGRRILLVDDVMTTGATLAAGAAALRRAGAVSVTAFALALTPLPGPFRLS